MNAISVRSTKWLVFAAALILMVHQTYFPTLRHALEYARWVPVFLLCLVVLASLAISRRLPRRIEHFDLLIVGFILYAFFSASYSIDPRPTVLRAGTLVLFYGAIFWAMWPYADKFREWSVIASLLGAGAILYGLSMLLIPFAEMSFPYHGRFRGLMENPNSIGLLTAILLPLALQHAFERRQKRDAALVLIMLASLILSGSRTGLVAVIMGSGYVLFHALSRHRLLLTFIFACVLIALSWGWLQLSSAWMSEGWGTPVQQSLGLSPAPDAGLTVVASPIAEEAILEEDEGQAAEPTQPGDLPEETNSRKIHVLSMSDRIAEWSLGLKYLWERPLWGFGFGTEDQLHVRHGHQLHLMPFSGAYMHNSYLGLALQLGITGALIFFAPLLMLLAREFWPGMKRQESSLRYALRGVLLAGLVSAFFESWIYSMGNAFAFPFWMSVMLLLRLGSRQDQSSPTAPVCKVR